MEISFCSLPNVNRVIAANVCTCHDICIVVACAKFVTICWPRTELKFCEISIEFEQPWENRSWNGPRQCFIFITIHSTEVTLSWCKVNMAALFRELFGYFAPISSMMTSSKGTFSALLVLCDGNSPVTGGLSSQRPVAWSFDAFFDLHLSKRLSKQSRRWWLETLSRSLWRHCNGPLIIRYRHPIWIARCPTVVSPVR